jgi:hypothetical protein
MDHTEGPSAVTAAQDLLPLARAIFAILPRLRGAGFVPLPNEASVFFLYAACQGVAHYLAVEFPDSLPPRMHDAASKLAPEIARLLHELATRTREPSGSA